MISALILVPKRGNFIGEGKLGKFYNDAWLYECAKMAYENMILKLLIDCMQASMTLYVYIKWISWLWCWVNVSLWMISIESIPQVDKS